MSTKVDIKANVQSDRHSTTTGEKSLKSLRTYQLGIVYKDKYGRETPVFTNEDASFTVPKNLSNTKNSIVTSLKNTAPDWVDSYKFFIKETSNEYYNLCMDRWYDAEDGNIWLSFPSAERNKIQEDTFIILKKKAEAAEAIHEEGRYKVIDIQNEAPDFIKTDYEKYGETSLTVDTDGALPGGTTIKITKATWEAVTNPFYDAALVPITGTAGPDGDEMAVQGVTNTGFIGWPLENVVVDLSSSGSRTGWLDVANIYFDSTGADFYYIQLSKPFEGTANTNVNISTGGILSVLPTGAGAVTVRLAKKVVKNKSEFNGKFFVKILRDPVVDTHVRSVNNPAPSFNVISSVPYWYLYGTQDPDDNYDAYWGSVGEKIILDNVKRRSVGTGSGTGTKGPWLEDDGYGIDGIRPSPHGNTTIGPYTMELSLQKIKDTNKDGFSTASNSADKVGFMNLIGTEGTKFRFKEDPFQHIYVVTQARSTFNDGSLQGEENGLNKQGIYNYGSQKGHRKEKNNKAHRVYVRFKTTGYRLDVEQASSGTYSGFASVEEHADKFPFTYGANNQPNDFYEPEIVPITPLTAPTAWDPTKRGYGVYGGSLGNNGSSATATWTTIGQAVSTPGGPPGTFTEADTSNTIQIVDTQTGDAEPIASKNPAIWETEPKEDLGLDIYYEASQAYPLFLDDRTNELFAPFGAKVSCVDTINNKSLYLPSNAILYSWEPEGHGGDTAMLNVKIDEIGIIDHTQVIQEDQTLPSPNPLLASTAGVISNLNQNFQGIEIRFTRQDGSYTTAKAVYFSGYGQFTNPPYSWFNDGYSTAYSCGDPTGTVVCNDKLIIKLDRSIGNERVKLPYFNCYAFGNGVESDRIRDDFNAVRLDKGVKASTVLDEPYEEEQRANGLIYSGIYNSNSGINNLNQFIAAEKITKDVNPSYGSIQKLKQRDTNLVAFCEDKVLKIMANKDAIYNADINPQLIASNKVLGNVTTFAGEFGISRNPESFAEESFRMYFTDKQRGKVLRLSQDGITPISDVGMKDFFADNLKLYDNLIGSFDDRKGEYNLTMTKDN